MAAALTLGSKTLLMRRRRDDEANVAGRLWQRLENSPPHPDALRPTGGEGEEMVLPVTRETYVHAAVILGCGFSREILREFDPIRANVPQS